VLNPKVSAFLFPATARLNRVVHETYLGTRKIRAPAGGEHKNKTP